MKNKGLIIGILGLVLAAVACGIALSTYSLVRMGGQSRLLGSVPGYSAKGEQTQRFAVDGPGELAVRNAAGGITITAGTGNEVIITAQKTAWGFSRDEAERQLAAMNIAMRQEGGRVTVIFEQEERASYGRPNTVDLTIQVPAQMQVTANTNLGDVRLSGIAGDADLQTQYGAIDISATGGGLTANTDSGAVSVRGIEAGNGPVSLTSRYGKITLEEGSMASLSVDSGSGEVRLTGLQVAGPLVVKSSYGAVNLDRVLAESYDLDTDSGSITLDGARGPLKAHSGYGNITVSGAEEANLDLQTTSGQIRFSGTLGAGPHALNSGYGGIFLALPEGLGLSCKLATQYGQIKSDFPVTVSGTLDRGRWSGDLNGGGAQLQATTQSGDISLEVLNP